MSKSIPKITFGMIVLNGEPFLQYNLRAIYPFAYQIIVVEGAAPGARHIADEHGHSTDGTISTLLQFKKKEDPDNKLTIVFAEHEGYPNGFWPGEKNEQSQAYAQRATGDYLWQVDVDEFYSPEDMEAICAMLTANPGITAVSFPMITFWGGISSYVDGWYLRRGASTYHRLFKWGTGYSYATHRPPTVVDSDGVDTRSINWVHGKQLKKMGISLYHYSLLLPRQVEEKCIYYEQAEWSKRNQAQEWAKNSFLELKQPYRVHNVLDYPSWLERFSGEHPPQIRQMYNDILSGRIAEPYRNTEDIEKLLETWSYRIGRLWFKFLDYPDRAFRRMMRFWGSCLGLIRKYWRILVVQAILRVFKSFKNV